MNIRLRADDTRLKRALASACVILGLSVPSAWAAEPPANMLPRKVSASAVKTKRATFNGYWYDVHPDGKWVWCQECNEGPPPWWNPEWPFGVIPPRPKPVVVSRTAPEVAAYRPFAPLSGTRAVGMTRTTGVTTVGPVSTPFLVLDPARVRTPTAVRGAGTRGFTSRFSGCATGG